MNINNPTTFSTPDLTLSTSNSSGTAGALRADDSILVFSTSVPDAITFGQSGSAGSGNIAAYQNHAHAMAAESTQDVSCRVTHDASQSISNNSTTKLAFNTEIFDTDSFHDNTTNNSRLTIPEDGKYLVGINFMIGGTSGHVNVGILLNNDKNIGLAAIPNVSGASIAPTMSIIADLDADDYVEAAVYQDSGSAASVSSTANYTPIFWAVKIGD